MAFFGIDVSEHNGYIKWSKLKGKIDFAIIRAGYGKNHVDNKFIENINGCSSIGVPFGLYWYSYAYTEDMAINEAKNICDLAKAYHPQYPIFFEWGEDSEKYANGKNIKISDAKRVSMTRAFLDYVEKQGYYGAIYTGLNMYNRGFKELGKIYDIWLADWNAAAPSVPCSLWQTSCEFHLTGIDTNVNTDISFIDYALLSSTKPEPKLVSLTNEQKKKVLTELENSFWEKYTELGYKFKSGEYDKFMIEQLGYDPAIAEVIAKVI